MAAFVHYLLTLAHSYDPLLIEYGLVVILSAIVVEGAGIPAPGQSLLIAGALLSTRGEFNISLLLSLALLAAIVGSSLGYFIGRGGGRKLLFRLPLRASRFARMEMFCQRYGVLLVILSRFIDGPRQLTGIFVGSLDMPFIRFFFATSVGAVLWVGFWGLGSYYLGENARLISQTIESVTPYGWIAAGLLVTLLALYLIRRHYQRKKYAH